VNERKLTVEQAKETANKKESIVASCKTCNETEKGVKDLGMGSEKFQPSNPNDRVVEMMKETD
jgi:hypothetical protein